MGIPRDWVGMAMQELPTYQYCALWVGWDKDSSMAQFGSPGTVYSGLLCPVKVMTTDFLKQLNSIFKLSSL